MEIYERIRALRNELGLSMKDFGAQISLSQPLLSLIENGKAVVTDRTIRLICSNWNVNEEWLRYGRKPRFLPSSDYELKKQIEKYSFPEVCVKLLEAFDDLDQEQQAAVLAYAKRFIMSLVQDGNSNVTRVSPTPSKEEAAARQFLQDRVSGASSLTSEAGNNETA